MGKQVIFSKIRDPRFITVLELPSFRGSSELCVKQSCRHYSASRDETAPGARLTVRSNRKGVFSRRCMVEPILPITQSSEEPLSWTGPC